MSAADGRVVAGICHARGENAGLPPVWLVYITVADLDESLRRCVEGGGAVRVVPQGMGGMGRYVKAGDRVLLKASLLLRRKPEKAASVTEYAIGTPL